MPTKSTIVKTQAQHTRITWIGKTDPYDEILNVSKLDELSDVLQTFLAWASKHAFGGGGDVVGGNKW